MAPFVLLFDVSPGVEGGRDGSRVAALHRLVKWAALRSPRIGLPLRQHDDREAYTPIPHPNSSICLAGGHARLLDPLGGNHFHVPAR
ncbi:MULTISPECIES: hypothetical protein [unclassified Rhizobium]|uniref:hypothetical protein n=1 Tax=unclassified Rhizobium TaxID=2613769 RepID=UPI0012EB1B26|nr:MULTISPECIES: hypothetical protein [unclassified Rhizobium]